MNRRRFLEAAAVGALVAKLPARPASRRYSGQVMTVLGPLAPKRLGQTLMHEHVLVDFAGADKVSPERYSSEEVYRAVLPHLQDVIPVTEDLHRCQIFRRENRAHRHLKVIAGADVH